MKNRRLFGLTLLTMVVTMMAVPAKKGQWKTLTLSDGTEVSAMLVGDEFGHYWMAPDGNAYTLQNGFYQQVEANAICNRAKTRRAQVNAQRVKRLPANRVGEVGSYLGPKKGIIILVNFSDKQFKNGNNNALYTRIANEENFNQGKFKGSMADYFKAQSRGWFELDFDVIGPVTVSKGYAYYGENVNMGGVDEDSHAAEMVIEAVNLAKEEVADWTPYDWDGDGYVDQVYVVYAGLGEADGGAADTIWPHAYDLQSAKSFGDGTGPVTVGTNLKVNTYACGPELNGSNMIEGIGTMCHEFSHCLGYPDFYDIDYSGGQGMGEWDLMDAGSYNGDGYQPAGYTSYERWVAGWMEPIVLEEEDKVVENMKSLQNDGESYIIYNKANHNEYYLLENRQLEGWDASLPSAGLLIIHADYDAQVWAANGPNDDPNHQRMTVVPADGKYQSYTSDGNTYFTYEGLKTDPFPQGGVTAFNKDFKTYDQVAKKAARLFNKNTNGTYWIDSSVEDIIQNNKTISFHFVAIYEGSGGGDIPEGALFYESFDECDGTGGNDDQWNGSIASSEFVPDNDGWESDKAYGAYQCAKFGTSSKKGAATTPAITISNEAKLTFKAGAWDSNKDGTTLNLTVSDGTVDPVSVEMTKGAFNDYEVTISATGDVTITFEANKGRFFLDDVLVMPVATGIQDITARPANTGRIYTLDGRYVNTDFQQLQRGLYIINGKKVVK